jgi:hypothetical protein
MRDALLWSFRRVLLLRGVPAKAYRARTGCQSHNDADLREPNAVQRARRLRKRAQLAHKAAAATRSEAAVLRDSRRQLRE